MVRILAIALIAILTFLVVTFLQKSPKTPDTARTIARCETSSEGAEQILLDRVSSMASLFEEKSDKIWTGGYRLDETPLLFIALNAENEKSHAYLLNHDHPEFIENACLMNLPQHANLGDVYHFESLPTALEEVPGLAFQYEFAGENTYLIQYAPVGPLFASPQTWDWALFIAHEGLHRDQQLRWKSIESEYVAEDYPIDQQNLAFILLEHKLLLEAYETNQKSERDRAMLEYAAVRAYRIETWPETEIDLRQEQLEGTARYVEYRLMELANYTDSRLADNQILLPIWANDVVLSYTSGFFSFNRFYISGSALGLILDEMELNWKERVEAGKSPSEVLIDHFADALQYSKHLLESAKSRHDFNALLDMADQIISWEETATQNNPNSPYAYAIPENSPPVNEESLQAIEDNYPINGSFRISSEAISPAERPYFSPSDSDVDVIVLAGPFNQETRVHISETEFPSTRDWYREVVEQNPRLPLLQMTEAEGSDIAFTVGVLGSFITINNGRFLHITGAGNFQQKLAIARNLLESD